jgi:hypothetical protein
MLAVMAAMLSFMKFLWKWGFWMLTLTVRSLMPFVPLCLKSLEHIFLMFVALSMGNIQKVVHNMLMLQYQQFLMIFVLIKMAMLLLRRMWHLVLKAMRYRRQYLIQQAKQRLRAARQTEKEARQAAQAARQAERQAEKEMRAMRAQVRNLG